MFKSKVRSKTRTLEEKAQKQVNELSQAAIKSKTDKSKSRLSALASLITINNGKIQID